MSNKKSDDRDDRSDCRDDDRDDDRARDGRRDDEHGAGRTILGTSRDDILTGTTGNDRISGGDGNDTINAGAGNDYVDGGKGNDTIDGGSGNDRLDGGAGYDTFIGGAGNDIIDGGSGLDVAVFSGNFLDYKLTLSRDGGHQGEDDDDHSAMTVHDRRLGYPDGVDVLKNVEILRFADGEYRDGHFISNNTPAVISGTTTGSVVEAGGVANADAGTPTATGTLTDTDVDNPPNTFQAVAAGTASHGTYTMTVGGVWTYTLNNADPLVQALNTTTSLSDSFTVRTVDGTQQLVTITINGANDAAVLSSADVALNETNAPITTGGTLTITDVDSSATFVAQTGVLGTNGTFSINAAGVWSYTANSAFDNLNVGQWVSDQFTVAAVDGTTTTVKVTINGTNDQPVATNATVNTGENATLSASVPTATDVDGTINPAGYALATGLGAGNGSLIFNSNGAYTFNPGTDFDALATDASRDVSFTYTAMDNLGAMSVPKTVTIHVVGTNDLPVATAVTVTTGENTTLTTTTPLAASDVDGTIAPFGYALVTGVGAGNGTLAFNANGTYSFNPGTNFDALAFGASRDVSFTYTATDNLGAVSAPQTVTIHVAGTNDAPVLSDTTNPPAVAEMAGDSSVQNLAAITGSFAVSDLDVGNTLTASVVGGATVQLNGSAFTLPAGATAITAGGAFAVTGTTSNGGSTGIGYTYDPAAANLDFLREGQSLTITYVVKVNDGAVDSGTQDVTFTITGTNDAPVAPAQTALATEGGTNVTANALATATDVDSNISALTAVNVPAAGLLPPGVSYNSGTHVFTLNPTTSAYESLAQGAHSLVTVNYAVSDGITSTPTAVTFDITGTNDAPVLTAPAIIDFDTTLPDFAREVVGQLSTFDVDAGATQTYSAVGFAGGAIPTSRNGYDLASAGHFGTLYLNSTTGDYSFVYNPAIDALVTGVNGDDTFSVSVSDLDAQTIGHQLTDTKSLTIHLIGTNDAPVISGVMPFNYTINDPAKLVAPGLTISDPDSDQITSAIVLVNAGFTADDVLSLDNNTLPAGVTAVYDGGTGVLTITGPATLAQYAAILDSVTFHATAAGVGGRTIAFTVFEDSLFSNTATTDNLSLLDLSTSVLRLPGVSALDTSGFSASAAGDVNNDGYGDLIIGAPFADIGGDITGSSYVVYGKASGLGVDSGFGVELPLASLLGPTGFSITGANAGDRTGFSVRDAGDMNGDGFSDVIIGAPYANPDNGNLAGTDQFGGSYVVFGHGADSVANVDLSSLNGTNGFSVIGAGIANWAGYSAGGAGDVNGDGFADVIIGAPTAGTGNGDQSGAAYVLFGHDSSFVSSLNLASLTAAQGFVMIGASAGDWAGASVSTAGDVNGDGISDMVIGTATPTRFAPILDPLSGLPILDDNGDPVLNPLDPYVTPASASAYVVFGSTSSFGSSVNLSTLNGTNGFSFHNAGTSVPDPLVGFGRGHYAVRAAGDVNGDGFADVIVGAPYASTSHGLSGAAYVVFGTTGGFDPSVNLASLAPIQGFEILGAATSDRTGYSVSAAGDVNGDGYGDLIIGAPSAQQNGSPAGTSYLVFGKASGFGTVDLSNLGNDGFRISAAAPHNDSGYAVTAAGDVNGDGFADVLVASSSASPHTGEYAGESYVIFGAKFITTPNTQVGNGAPGTDYTLTGSTVDDILVAGQGNATMVGGGGADSFSGGAGNDTVHLGASGSNDSSFLKVDGGGGFDTLVLDGSGMVLDLTTPGVAGRIHNIERIDLGGHGNTLALDIHDVLNMSDNGNQLFVTGAGTDSVSSLGQGWVLGPVPVVDHGISYDSYTSGVANLLIDQLLPIATVPLI